MRKRLDHLLVEKQLAPSRSRARDVIQRGLVSVAGRVVHKAGYAVDPEEPLTVADGAGLGLVSRGGLKLEAALDAFDFDPTGHIALDVGASTGGFTEVLLAHGAKKVFSVDVGHTQLHPRVRSDPRVVVLERTDARDLTVAQIPDPISVLVADVSFVSLTKVLPAALVLAAPQAWLVALIKPQFEVGPAGVGKDGIVRDATLRDRAARQVCDWLAAQPGWHVLNTISSPIVGGAGNHEILLGATRHV